MLASSPTDELVDMFVAGRALSASTTRICPFAVMAWALICCEIVVAALSEFELLDTRPMTSVLLCEFEVSERPALRMSNRQDDGSVARRRRVAVRGDPNGVDSRPMPGNGVASVSVR